MSAPRGSILRALRAIARALRPLDGLLADSDTARALLIDLGVNAPLIPASFLQLRGLVQQLSDALIALEDLLTSQDESSPQVLASVVDLGLAAEQIFRSLNELAQRLRSELAAYPDLLSEIDINEIARRLSSRLLIEYVRETRPAVYNSLLLLGLIEVRDVAAGADYVSAHTYYAIRADRLRTWSSDPAAVLSDCYGWGTTEFDHRLLLVRLQYLLLSLGYPSTLDRLDDDPLPTSEAPPSGDVELHLPIFFEVTEVATAGLDAVVRPTVPPNADDTGILFIASATGQLAADLELFEGVTLTLGGDFEATGGTGFEVRPPLRVQPVTGQAASTQAGTRFALALVLHPDDGSRIALLNQPGLLTLDIAGIAARAVVDLRTSTDPALQLELELLEGLLIISLGDGDSFLQNILPRDGIQAPFNLGLGWQSDRGFYLLGSGGFEVRLPVSVDLFGIIHIDAIGVALDVGDTGVEGELSFVVQASIGPFTAVVEGLGATLLLQAREQGGNLGPVQASINFKPPNGIGLSISAGLITGGGYLFANHDIGQYAGAVHLAFKAISLQALGILNVRMPDGSPIRMPDGSEGFSLLIIISAEFTPLQLGFGFTLNGVGGILGINRMLAADVLRSGIREGTLESVLFPRNPAENAPQIISTLSSVFPIALNSYVFGPMARIGWGTPTLLTFDLGIVLEFGRGLRLAILGRMRMNLPDENAPIVRMNMDVLGIFDFDRGEVSIDASLYDSLIAGFIITGDMALRASWGAQPAFALSAGGFNPRFTPPAGFPALRRLSIALPTGDNPRLRLEAYLALTSNTVQFGARVDLYAEALGFSIAGMLAFDALVQLAPFGFVVDIAGAVALRRGNRLLMGIAAELTLSGPRPWYARGRATAKILFFSVSINFEVTIGEREPLPLPNPVDVRGRLVDALSDPRNWSAQLPNEGDSLVALRQIEVSEGQILAHPLGNIRFHQRDVPLGETLERFGSAPIDGDNRFDVRSVTYGDDPLDLAEIEYEYFAQAQFFDLTEDEKLSAPSFVLMQAGRRVRWSGIDFDESKSITPEDTQEAILITPEALTVEYETAIIDDFDQDPRWVAEPQSTTASELERLASVGAAGLTTLRGLASGQTPERALAVRVHDTAYSLVDTSPAYDRQMASIESTRSPMTYTQARANLRRVAGDNPRRASRIRVVSERALG